MLGSAEKEEETKHKIVAETWTGDTETLSEVFFNHLVTLRHWKGVIVKIIINLRVVY